MLKIDNTLLEEIGLAGLPDAEKNSFLKHIYETLEMRVGIRLADQMSNEQLDEFERYFEAKDDAGAFKWLETNFPNYKDIVQEEFDKLKAEVAQTAPQILAASQNQAALAGQAGVQPVVAPTSTPTPIQQTPAPAPVAQSQPVTPIDPAQFQPAQQPVSAPAPAPYPAEYPNQTPGQFPPQQVQPPQQPPAPQQPAPPTATPNPFDQPPAGPQFNN